MKVTLATPDDCSTAQRQLVEFVRLNLEGVRVEFGNPPSKRGFRFVLRTTSKASPFMRRAASGRATVGVNWEAHRLVMVDLFSRYPTARIQSALADYQDREGFEREHGATYNKNTGSAYAPVAFGDL